MIRDRHRKGAASCRAHARDEFEEHAERARAREGLARLDALSLDEELSGGSLWERDHPEGE